jgi:hypothetical protein
MNLGAPYVAVTPPRPVTAGMTGKALTSAKPGPNGFRTNKAQQEKEKDTSKASPTVNSVSANGNNSHTQTNVQPLASVPSGLIHSLFDQAIQQKPQLAYEAVLYSSPALIASLSSSSSAQLPYGPSSSAPASRPSTSNGISISTPQNRSSVLGSQIQPTRRPSPSPFYKKQSTLNQGKDASLDDEEPYISIGLIEDLGAAAADVQNTDTPSDVIRVTVASTTRGATTEDEDEPAITSMLIQKGNNPPVDPRENFFNDIGGWADDVQDDDVARALGLGKKGGAAYQYLAVNGDGTNRTAVEPPEGTRTKSGKQRKSNLKNENQYRHHDNDDINKEKSITNLGDNFGTMTINDDILREFDTEPLPFACLNPRANSSDTNFRDFTIDQQAHFGDTLNIYQSKLNQASIISNDGGNGRDTFSDSADFTHQTPFAMRIMEERRQRSLANSTRPSTASAGSQQSSQLFDSRKQSSSSSSRSSTSQRRPSTGLSTKSVSFSLDPHIHPYRPSSSYSPYPTPPSTPSLIDRHQGLTSAIIMGRKYCASPVNDVMQLDGGLRRNPSYSRNSKSSYNQSYNSDDELEYDDGDESDFMEGELETSLPTSIGGVSVFPTIPQKERGILASQASGNTTTDPKKAKKSKQSRKSESNSSSAASTPTPPKRSSATTPETSSPRASTTSPSSASSSSASSSPTNRKHIVSSYRSKTLLQSRNKPHHHPHHPQIQIQQHYSSKQHHIRHQDKVSDAMMKKMLMLMEKEQQQHQQSYISSISPTPPPPKSPTPHATQTTYIPFQGIHTPTPATTHPSQPKYNASLNTGVGVSEWINEVTDLETNLHRSATMDRFALGVQIQRCKTFVSNTTGSEGGSGGKAKKQEPMVDCREDRDGVLYDRGVMNRSFRKVVEMSRSGHRC